MRLVVWVLFGGAALLLPWMVVLGVTLPGTAPARHWSTAWIGLDVMEAAAMVTTGTWALRRDTRAVISASATAALLLTDAWFDVATAQPQWDYLQSMLLAVLIEVPLAMACVALACRALRWRTEETAPV